MLISIPPKYAVSQVVGYSKGKSAIHMARTYGERARISRASHLRAVRGQTPAAFAAASGVCPLSIAATNRSRPIGVSRAFL